MDDNSEPTLEGVLDAIENANTTGVDEAVILRAQRNVRAYWKASQQNAGFCDHCDEPAQCESYQECPCICHEPDLSGYGAQEHPGQPCPCGTTRQRAKAKKQDAGTDSEPSEGVFHFDPSKPEGERFDATQLTDSEPFELRCGQCGKPPYAWQVADRIANEGWSCGDQWLDDGPCGGVFILVPRAGLPLRGAPVAGRGAFEELACAAANCAAELQAEIEQRYGYPNVHPAMQHRFDRDMEMVNAIRPAIEKARATFHTQVQRAELADRENEQCAGQYEASIVEQMEADGAVMDGLRKEIADLRAALLYVAVENRKYCAACTANVRDGASHKANCVVAAALGIAAAPTGQKGPQGQDLGVPAD